MHDNFFMNVTFLLVAAVVSGCHGPAQQQFAYPAILDAGYTIPAIPRDKIQPEYQRKIVDWTGDEAEGSILIDTSNKFLYSIMADKKAMRYGIGVGRDGLRWSGEAYVGRKQPWPNWSPTPAMIRRDPDLLQYANGVKPGIQNPLGARALYLYQNGKDTLYRLHGTPEWWTIGGNISSGCIRMTNFDILDLYQRTPVGTKVIVQ